MAYTTIDKPTDYFNTVLYTGDGNDGRTVTGVGFQPDWVWIKNRDTTNWHIISDSVRGGNNRLVTNRTDAERSDQTWWLQTFDSDGFTVGIAGDTNGNGNNLVSWNWLASNTTASNTDGSITSTVSANQTAGFSIVSYTGNGSSSQTVGHGLNSTVDMVIVKDRDRGSENWVIYHKSLGKDKLLLFNTDAVATSSNYWGSSTPNSTVFGVKDGSTSNNWSGDNFIAYCFAEKKGFSKFGSYTGNGNSDGTFVYTGFSPSFVMIKSSSLGQDWFIHDNKRSTFNVSNTVLLPNTADLDITDTTVYGIDMVSNGFKVRGTHARINQSGSSYIYMCFAENPFVTSTGIPTTAR